MENFALIAIVENLRPAMSEVIIRRVVQHQRNGFTFQTRSLKLPAFKVVADAQNPALYGSESRLPIESTGADFLMVLRKHLTSAELVGLHKPLSERIVEFSFKTTVPSKDLETMSLIFEMLPNAPNIILLDAERRVVSTFVPITPQHGFSDYETYSYPNPRDKIPLEQVLESDGTALKDISAELLVSKVAGIGPVFARELVYRQGKSGRPMVELMRTMLEQVQSPSRAAWIYTELPLGHILEANDVRNLNRAIVSPIELESLSRSHSSRLFAHVLDATKFYFDEWESRSQLEQAKMPILRDMRQVTKRLADREKRLLREQQKYHEAEGLQKTAQMLTSSGMKMDQHYDSIRATDYFGERPTDVEIELDQSLSLKENVEKMFKRYHKAGRGKNFVAQQLGQIRNRMALVGEQTRRLQAIKDWDTWLAIASKIPAHEARVSTTPVASGPASPAEGKRFRSINVDGREILIGKGARENDELTFEVAAPDDFWFHVAEYSGSHVIVRNPGKEKELDDSILVKAAQLAAYFSQARNTSKIEVHYTKRRHVTKARRAKPGLVRLLEFKTIKVEPKNWLNS